jgi:hypothetical protein
MSETETESTIVRDAEILDLAPALRRKKAAQCKHRNALVSFEEASLVCDECGADLDPWSYLRMLANEREASHRQWEREQAERAEARKKFDAWVVEANAKIARWNDEIQALVDTKNKLWNERAPDGRTPIGMLVRRRRKRKVAT